jgi:hypothetical protein
MTTLTEVQTSDKMVKIAREQVDAFNKIKESRHYFDSLTLLKQIGAQPK